MNIVEIKVTQVTLPDGTRAWFESRETAEAVGNQVDTVVKIGCGFGGKKVKPAKVKVEPKTFPLKDAKPVAEKAKKSAKATAKKAEKAEKKPAKKTGYQPKPCAACGKDFVPRCGRQQVCDECRGKGAKPTSSPAKKAQQPKPTASETPKAKGKGGKADEKPSDALEEVRKLAKIAHLGPYKE